MAQHVIWAGNTHGWRMPPWVDRGHEDAAVTAPDPVFAAFLGGGILYALAALGALVMQKAGAFELADAAGWVGPAAGALAVGAGLSVLASLWYGMPWATGGRLAYPGLAWLHFGVLNAGILGPLAILASWPDLDAETAAQLLICAVALEALGIAFLIANLLATTAAERPAPG